MSINAIGGVSGSRKAHINMADQSIYFTNDILTAPPLQAQPISMISTLMQALLQALQLGRSSLGQGGGGGQRGGGFQGGDQHGSQAEAAHGTSGADAAAPLESSSETLDGADLDTTGANGLLDAISGLLAAIAPLLGGMGDGAAGDGSGCLSANDDAFHLAGRLRAEGI